LLKDDVTAIDEILNPNYSMEAIPLEKRINSARIDVDNTENIELKIIALNDLKELYELVKLNRNGYYALVQEHIHLELVDTLNAETINRVNTFLDGISYEKVLTR